jgi:hypothetical protein
MRAVVILRRYLSRGIGCIHAFRKESVLSAVQAVVVGGSLALTNIGRSLAERTSHKHGIKRADRLLGNTRLHAELTVWYRAVARRLIGRQKHPLILVDWTEANGAPQHAFDALVAALPAGKRSIPIYSLVVPHTLNNKPAVHRRFLVALKSILPTGCEPIIVTDAGFRTPWFQLVRRQGWDFIGRIRSRVLVENDAGWLDARKLYPLAKRSPQDLGTRLVTRSRQLSCRLVLVRRSARPFRETTIKKPRRVTEQRAASGASEPWLLATSAQDLSRNRVVAIYARRMAIEEVFRDHKSHRFGWGFRDVGSKSAARLAVLLLLAVLATLAATLVGFAIEMAGLHRAFQANTVTHRRVLSWRSLGAYALNRGIPPGRRGKPLKLGPLPEVVF